MGFSFKKAFTPPKAVRKIGDGVVKNAGTLIKDPKKGLGNITDSYVNTITLGQSGLVDQFTGGAVSSLKGAYRGNTKDIARVGITVGAAALTGGTGAFLANKAFASGQGPIQAGLSAATEGTGMGWLDDTSKFLSNPAVSGIISSSISKPKPMPAPQPVQTVVYQQAPATIKPPMDQKTKLMISGGVALFVLALIFGLRGKK
jgi:hypothetical protein